MSYRIEYVSVCLIKQKSHNLPFLGNLEVFHSFMLKFAPKRIHFEKDTMVARTQLAAVDHNENTGRAKAVTREGNLTSFYASKLWNLVSY